MEGYKGRKTSNVSHYLANLNALPSAHDTATQQQQQQQQQDEINFEDELAQFTNTDFLDFDAETYMEPSMPEYDPSLEEKARRDIVAANNKINGKAIEYVTGMLNSANPQCHTNTTLMTHC